MGCESKENILAFLHTLSRKKSSILSRMNQSTQKISISVSTQLLRFAENYQSQQHLPSRSDVFSAALIALREKQLAESYQAWNLEQRRNPDPLVSLDNTEGLEPGDGSEWL